MKKVILIIKKQLSLYLKEKVLNHYLIPFSRTECDPALVEHLEKKPINLIDVGASTGEFARNIDKYFGIKNAVLIEPIPSSASNLIAISNKTKIVQCALSNKMGFKKFYHYNFHYSSSLLKTLEANEYKNQKSDRFKFKVIKVQVDTLDNIFKKNFSQEIIDLLKIDVQGNELNVLKGGQKCLSKIRHIYLEVSFKQLYEKSCLFIEIDKFLRVRGFNLISLREGYRSQKGELLQADALYKNLKY